MQKRETEKKTIAPRYMIPILTKPGYTANPAIEEISTYSETELSNVSNFKIKNQFGTIIWEGHTDVRNLDLNKLVEINKQEVK